MTDEMLLTTPLHDSHVRLGARMVPFAGYDMPVQYEGILAESRAVRTGAGIFDVSHMGRLMVEGPLSRALLDWVHTADIGEAMPEGRARYGLICTETGGIIDDGIIYRMGPERFMLIANAANAEKVFAWVTRWRDDRFNDATLDDITQRVSMIALQGPKALEIAIDICDFDVTAVRTFRIAEGMVNGQETLVARTGYTGEDGFELMPPAEHAAELWNALVQRRAVPCGLGARDTLRLEAGLLLHGSDMDESINPIEAGLDRFVKLNASDFCGDDAIRAIAEQGPERRIAAFRMNERGAAPRPHSPILAEGNVVGQVSSGGYGPSVDANIGLGYVPARFATPDSKLQIDVRGKILDASVLTLPFYSRPR